MTDADEREPSSAERMLAEELWKDAINIWKWPGNLVRVPAAHRAIAAGAAKEDVLTAMRAAAYLAIEFGMFAVEAGHGEPRPWRLAEVDENGRLAEGTVGVSGVLERFDPSGQTGADLWR
jgi:hypothetical protein